MARADRATWAKRVQTWKAGGLTAEAYAAKIVWRQVTRHLGT